MILFIYVCIYLFIYFFKTCFIYYIFLNGLFLYLFIYLFIIYTNAWTCMYYVNMRYIKSLWDSKARLIAVLAGVLCHVPRLHSLSQAAQSGSSQCFRLDFADSLASMLLCRTPRNQDSSTLQDSFRILQHSAVVLELVQATGKATLPRSRRPSFSFMKSQGCKIQELQTGTCLRSQVLLWQ